MDCNSIPVEKQAIKQLLILQPQDRSLPAQRNWGLRQADLLFSMKTRGIEATVIHMISLKSLR